LLFNRWFAWGALCCFLILLPNLVWQYANGFPSIEFYRNAMVNKNVPRGALNVVLDQVLFANPFALIVLMSGLMFLFGALAAKQYRFLGWSYTVLLLAMIVSQSSRPDRIGATYTILFAAGAVAIEKLGAKATWRWVPGFMIGLLIVGAIIFAPVVTPVLSPPVLRSYLSTIGFSASIERDKSNEPIPQWLADRLGWQELALDVARVFHSLPDGERTNTVIVSTNYGEAGALELYGPGLGLPAVYATHNSYHLWGSPPDSVRTYIAVRVNGVDLSRRFESVVVASVHTCDDCTRPQQRIPIYVARGPKFSLTKEWANLRIYN
jgi:hypothetical protein